MKSDNILELRYLLRDCPEPWRNFRKNVTGPWSTKEQCIDSLNAYGYNAKFEEKYDRTYYLVFPNKEEKARFILTWG